MTFQVSQWKPSEIAKSRIVKRRSVSIHGMDAACLAAVYIAILWLLMPTSVVDSWAFTYHTRVSETFGADARSTPGRRDDCYLHSGWNVFVANTQVQLADLPSQIAKSLAQGGERKIYLKRDAQAKYGDVKAVIECIKAAGIENIGLISN